MQANGNVAMKKFKMGCQFFYKTCLIFSLLEIRFARNNLILFFNCLLNNYSSYLLRQKKCYHFVIKLVSVLHKISGYHAEQMITILCNKHYCSQQLIPSNKNSKKPRSTLRKYLHWDNPFSSLEVLTDYLLFSIFCG